MIERFTFHLNVQIQLVMETAIHLLLAIKFKSGDN